MHFQIHPFEEKKIVFCVKGSIFDVVVDLRPNSKSVGKWTSIDLSSSSNFGLKIPSGFAHGYLTLEQNTEIVYLIDKEFSANHSFALDYRDKSLLIPWPEDITIKSKRDSNGISLATALALSETHNQRN